MITWGRTLLTLHCVTHAHLPSRLHYVHISVTGMIAPVIYIDRRLGPVHVLCMWRSFLTSILIAMWGCNDYRYESSEKQLWNQKCICHKHYIPRIRTVKLAAKWPKKKGTNFIRNMLCESVLNLASVRIVVQTFKIAADVTADDLIRLT